MEPYLWLLGLMQLCDFLSDNVLLLELHAVAKSNVTLTMASRV